MKYRTHIRIREPIIHREWEAATASLVAMLGHEKVAPLATDVPRWTNHEDPSEPGQIQVYQTSLMFRPLLEGQLAVSRQEDPILKAGYEAMQYFTKGDVFTGTQTTKPLSYLNLGSFGH